MKIMIFKNNEPILCNVTSFDDIAKEINCDYIEMLHVRVGNRNYDLIVDEEGKLRSEYVSGLLCWSYGNTFLVGHIAITISDRGIGDEDYDYIKKHLEYRGGLPVFYAQTK